jgi:two-component system response regulator AtoC
VKPKKPPQPVPRVDSDYAETKGTRRTRTTPADEGSGFGLLVSCEAGVYVVPLEQGEEFTLGRMAECDIAVNDASISRRHARLVIGDTMTLEDLGSTNGTRLGERRLKRGERLPVAIGTVFELGSATFVLQRLRGLPESPSSEPVPSSRRAAEEEGPVLFDPTMRNLYAMLDLVAPSPLSILVLGETGVGKELYAAAVHERSRRASRPFLQLNCAALAETILEGELFGYEKGAFTGAVSPKAGLFESADGGTVFLDEVGELPLSTQAKLLRVLESGEVMRLGALKPKKVDVRFVAATNRDLRKLIGEGRFRADLYFRLNGMSITLPALRSRVADIAPLARRFADRVAQALDRQKVRLTPRAERALERYTWPGNVRELKNVIDRAVVLCQKGELDLEQLVMAEPDAFEGADVSEASKPPPPRGPLDTAIPPRPSGTTMAGAGKGDLKDELRSIEKQRILDALARTAGNQSQAARMLGMSRYTLMSRIEEYGLVRPRKGRE